MREKFYSMSKGAKLLGSKVLCDKKGKKDVRFYFGAGSEPIS